MAQAKVVQEGGEVDGLLKGGRGEKGGRRKEGLRGTGGVRALCVCWREGGIGGCQCV